jgi:hypothetical protein
MSLIDEFMTDCTILNRIKISDGEGGTYIRWEDGPQIKAAIVHDSSTLAKIAESQGVTSVYTITTARNVELEYPDVIRRDSDGETFQITSRSERKSPKISSMDIAQVSARRWELTDDEGSRT